MLTSAHKKTPQKNNLLLSDKQIQINEITACHIHKALKAAFYICRFLIWLFFFTTDIISVITLYVCCNLKKNKMRGIL